MTDLRKTLIDQANKDLDDIIREARRNLIAQKHSIDLGALIRLSSSNKTETLRKKVVRDMANTAEQKLVEIYNQQQDLAVDEPVPFDPPKDPSPMVELPPEDPKKGKGKGPKN